MRNSRQLPGSVWRLLASTAVVLVVTAALAGCAGSLRPPAANVPTPVSVSTSGAQEVIGVVKEGWHTGLIVPVAAMGASLPGLRRWFPDARYLVFGWGNRAFYMATRPGAGTALAALLPSASVMFVRALADAPETALPPGSKVRWVCASAKDVSRLETYLKYYLQTQSGEPPVSIEPGPLPHSRFFASTGHYDAFHTCNTWTVAGLEFAGLPVSAEGVLFSGQAMSRISALRACHRPEVSQK